MPVIPGSPREPGSPNARFEDDADADIARAYKGVEANDVMTTQCAVERDRAPVGFYRKQSRKSD